MKVRYRCVMKVGTYNKWGSIFHGTHSFRCTMKIGHRLVSYVRSSVRSGVFGKLSGASAHAFIFEMVTSGVLPCRENGNNLKWVVN